MAIEGGLYWETAMRLAKTASGVSDHGEKGNGHNFDGGFGREWGNQFGVWELSILQLAFSGGFVIWPL